MMRFPFQTLCAGALLIVASAAPLAAQPQREFAPPPNELWMGEKVSAPTQELPLDEALRETARATSINAFVDATDLPADQLIRPYEQRPKDFFETNYNGRSNVLKDLTKQAQMTKARVGRETFVFWREPDLNRVVNLIVARHRALDAQFPPDLTRKNTTTMRRASLDSPLVLETGYKGLAPLIEYLQRTQGWIAAPQNLDEQRQSALGIANTVKISQLPIEVQRPVQAELIYQIRSERGTPLPQWFDAASWQDARVRLVTEDANYFRPDGWVLGRAKARVIRVFFPNGRPSFVIGIPQWANPNFPALDYFETPADLNETASLDRFLVGAPTDDAPVAPLPLVNFERDARTKKRVKFAPTRQNLRALVADLQEQSGLMLRVADGFAPDAKILAITKGVKTSEALEAIERLYRGVWVPSEGGYTLQAQPMSELQTLMSRLGDTFEGGAGDDLKLRHVKGQGVAEEVSVALDADALQGAQGAPFSQLSDEVQAHVMQLFRDDKTGELVEMQRRFQAVEPLLDGFEMKFAATSPTERPLFVSDNYVMASNPEGDKISTLRALTPDGRAIVRLFPAFSVKPPSETQIEMEKQRAQGEEYLARTNPDFYEGLLKVRQMQAQQEQKP